MGLTNIFHGASGGARRSSGPIDPTKLSKIIIDSLDDGVLLIDDSQTIQLINPSAARLCGWKVEEATGISADLVLQLSDTKQNKIRNEANPLHTIFSLGQSFSSNQYCLINRANRSLPISLHISPLADKDNKIYQAVAVINDISAEKSNEQQRADFISTASHEMRTPVAAIEGYLALALNDKVATVDERARNYLEKAHASTQHLGQLFQDLLTSAKAEDGRLTSHPVVIELGDFLTQLTTDLSVVAQKKGLAMDYVSGSAGGEINATKTGGERVVQPLYYVYVDPDRLREVMTNLFDNAIKYTMEGKVTIGLSGDDKNVQCFVKDTGPGIPADDLPHLFQKFYRVDNSATRTVGGTGLGLFICRKIIELYSGRIWAESEIGQGSTFYINLPRLTTKQAQEINSAGHQANTVQPVKVLASA